MAMEKDETGSAPGAALQQWHDEINEKKGQEGGLGWDYLSSKLGLGAPPDLPSIANAFTVVDVSLDLQFLRLLVTVRSPHGDGVALIYRGPFRKDPPPEDGADWRLYVGLKTGAELAIKDFPVVGGIDPAAFGIRGVQMLVTSHDMTADEAAALYFLLVGKPPSHELGGTDYTTLPTPPLSGVKSRLVFKTDLLIATANYPIVVEVGGPDAGGSQSGGDAAKPPGPSAGATVQKRIGAVTLNRVFGLYDGKASRFGLGIDAAVDFRLFKLAYQDCTVTFPASDVSGGPAFGLKGIELSGGVPGAAQFGGGLYVESLSPLNMWGEAIVNIASTFGFALMAGYATVDNQPSFFGFGFVKVPVGGPPFLEIKGGALGFAYNRDLVIPDIDQLDKFPFIQAAMSFANPDKFTNPFPGTISDSASLINTLEKLGTKIAPPKLGSYWGTIGIAFSSFKVVNGFALAALTVGSATRIAVVGELQVTLPPKPPGVDEVKTLVFLDSFLRLVIDLSLGEVALDAYIKHNSYIVEPNIRLTGGLAVRVWFGSEHHGEFVVSAGGYSPLIDMSPYSYYPTVPRLALSLDLGGGVQVQGRMYFTVTSSMVMFGLAFQVSGSWGPASVWAIIALDALLAWEPLHYDAQMVVEFGASFRIKVWFVHITITVHLGATLHIWGPPFSGQARLDLAICTVTVHLGADAASPPPLSWADFKTKYLTDARIEPGEPAIGGEQTKAVVDLQAQSTPLIVLQRSNADDAKWVVDPESLILRTHSVIPAKTWTLRVIDTDQPPQSAPNTAFGVGPCGVANDRFHTTHAVTIEGPGEVQFEVKPRIEFVPAALWGTGQKQPAGPDANIRDIVAGLELRPVHPNPDRTLPADADDLLAQTDVLHLRHPPPNGDHGGGFDGQTVSGSIAAPTMAVANRRKLFAAFAAHLRPGEMPDVAAGDVDVSRFAAGKDEDLFIGRPRLRLLGEDRAA